MTQRQRMNAAREYSRECRKRRFRRLLWAVDGVLLLIVLGLLAWAYRMEQQRLASLDAAPAAPETVQAETVEPTAALLSAVTGALPQGWFTVTGYCACCTPYADMNTNEAGQVLTAGGEWVEVGTCVAVDTDIIPLGSTVEIGGRTYRALDTGVYGHTIDILMSHEEAQCFGALKERVTWW